MKFMIKIAAFLMLFGTHAMADDEIVLDSDVVDYEVIETFGSNIRISGDGTGVVKNVTCKACTSKVLKITKNTKAYLGDKETDIVKARKASGNKVAMVRFNTTTNEVTVIRW